MRLSKKLIGLSLAATLALSTLLQAAPLSHNYLQHYFKLNSFQSVVTPSALVTAFEKACGLDLTYRTSDEAVTGYEAVMMLVDAADFEELALTYTAEQATAHLKSTYKINEKLDENYVQYIATALDTNLIDAKNVKKSTLAKTITKSDAEDLVMVAATTRGHARQMLGLSNDATIFSRLYTTWNNVEIIEDAELQAIGNEAVKSGLVTGYNILAAKNDANFLPQLTLRYGHSDIKHAAQLIGLLNREGIVAKVQLEPKTSAYEYLIEWGPIPEASPQYEVREEGKDFYVTYAAEYDLVLEFANVTDKLNFDTLVMDYAKKDSSNEEGKALLYGSWWQPLYTSTLQMPNYELIANNILDLGATRLTTFSLPEAMEGVKAGLESLSGKSVAQVKTWVDAPFFRYLNGEHE